MAVVMHRLEAIEELVDEVISIDRGRVEYRVAAGERRFTARELDAQMIE